MGVRLSIIIPSFNTRDLTVNVIRQCLKIINDDSIIIVIENDSHDNTKEILQKLFSDNDKVLIIYNEINVGYTKAINQGIREGEKRGIQYHCFLNTDVNLLNSNIFNKSIELIDTHQFGCLIFHDAVIGNNKQERLHWINDEVGWVDEGMWYYVIVPQTTIDKIGILDERFFLHCSDSDYQIRIKLVNMKVGVLKNDKYIQHTCFGSSRMLKNVQSIIKHDRELFNKKYRNPLNPSPYQILDGRMPRIEVRKTNDDPFLSVITRCYKRPKYLSVCKQSFDIQTDKDFEQIFIIDNFGFGMKFANQLPVLSRREYSVLGKYVMFLDDDDMIVEPDYIKILKQIYKTSNPPAVIFKGYINDKIFPPPLHIEKKTPQCCSIGSFNIAVRNDVFEEHLEVFGSDKSIGDFKFIRSIWNVHKQHIVWLDKIICKTQRVSDGRPQ